MRKLVLYTLMSLDGAVDHPGRYFAGSRSGEAPEFDSVMNDNEARIIGEQDAVLLGRHMYDEWSEYWPTSDAQPFADFINRVKKYVVTSTPLAREWHRAEAVAGPVEELVRDLKARRGGDIGVHGSIRLAQSLLAAGLVDELQLVVGPVIGFTGRRLFPHADDVHRLELLRATPTPSGSVLLAYRAADRCGLGGTNAVRRQSGSTRRAGPIALGSRRHRRGSGAHQRCAWEDDDGIADNRFSATAITLHEVGHALGLNHPNNDNVVMFDVGPVHCDLGGTPILPALGRDWTLAFDDADGYRDRYPGLTDTSQSYNANAGCHN
jgi:dihydrofolate reductase